MKLAISAPAPSNHELIKVLNDAFSGRYTFRQFGLGKNKTVMARRSSLVGVQISVVDSEIRFQPTAPTATGSLLSFLMLTELAVLLVLPIIIIFNGFTNDPYKEMSREIALFIKKKYG